MGRKKKVIKKAVIKKPIEAEEILDEELLLREHDYTARKLTRGDNAKLRELIIKYSEAVGNDDILNLQSSGVEETEETEETEADKKESIDFSVYTAAFNLFKEMLIVIETDLTQWFADLIGVTIEDFDKLPFDIEMDIIEDIITQKQFTSFFYKGLQVYKKTRRLVNRIKK